VVTPGTAADRTGLPTRQGGEGQWKARFGAAEPQESNRLEGL